MFGINENIVFVEEEKTLEKCETEKTLEKFMEFCSGGYGNFLIVTMISRFDFFNKIGDKSFLVSGIVNDFGIKERPAIVVIQLLLSAQYVKRTTNNDQFELTDFAKKYLLRRSEYDLTAYAAIRSKFALLERQIIDSIHKVLVTGEPLSWGGGSWVDDMDKQDVADDFTKAMDVRGRILAKNVAENIDLEGAKKLLDLGGSSGIYSKELLDINPGLEAIVLDKESVVSGGGLPDIQYQKGDFFKDQYPDACDVVLISNVLHDWNRENCTKLLQKTYDYLPNDGKVLIHDGHMEDNSKSLVGHSIIFMLYTEGRAYYKSEIFEMLEEVGFEDVEITYVMFGRSVISGRKVEKN